MFPCDVEAPVENWPQRNDRIGRRWRGCSKAFVSAVYDMYTQRERERVLNAGVYLRCCRWMSNCVSTVGC